MKSKMFMLTVLVLVSAAFVYLPFSVVLGQQSGTAISAVNPASGVVGSAVNVQGTIGTANGSYLVFFSDQVVVNSTSVGFGVNANFLVPSLQEGSYNLTLQDVASGLKATRSFSVAPAGISAIPIATVLIMGIAVTISFANMGLNRLLITKMIGWHEYRSMQKEMSEYNSQRMAALRSKDTKALEKLKKKESQIQAMQTKMFKPQLILIPITFIYLVIWPVLTGYFPSAVAYIPGLNVIPGVPGVPFFYWYLICSFFFGTIASRVVGVTPIQ